MSNPTSPWWRHDSNLSNDNRFAKLKARLGEDPYGLICRLYDFAASSQQDGILAQVDPEVLASRLEFKKRPKLLLKLLEESGYISATGYIIDWNEKLFRMFSSLREQNRQRGKKSAQVRAGKSVPANETEDNQTEQRGENITATVQRPVERSAEAPAPDWPEVLSEEMLHRVSSETNRSAEFVRLNYPAFRDRKVRFRDAFDAAGLCDFRDHLRTAKALLVPESPMASAFDNPEPTGWRDEFPDYVHIGKPWSDIPSEGKRHISEHMALLTKANRLPDLNT